VAISVETLIEKTRIKSGLRNNQLFSDSQIADLLSDGLSSLRDKLVVGNYAHWFRSSYEFSLTSDENTLDLSLVPLLEMVQGLDLLNGTAPPSTVPMLQSFANRNAGNGLWPLGISYAFNGQMGRNYEINGSELTVRPAANATGDYRLIYTPMGLSLALPSERSFSVTASDIDNPFSWTFNNGNFVVGDIGGVITPAFTEATRQFDIDPADTTAGGIGWAMANANFVTGDVGGTITPNFAAPNTAFNVAWTIASRLSSTTITTTPATSTLGTFTSPPSGTATVSALSNSVFNVPYTITDVLSGQQIEVTPDPQSLGVFQLPPTGEVTVATPAPGTISALPQPLTPWSEYIVLYASILIRTSRQQQIQELEVQLGQITARIVALTKQRSEGIRQAPITRGWGNIGGGGWGV
jgi:hypothetical protein